VHGVDLVIFDCDGVLVDSEPISARVLAAALCAEGLPTTEHEARRRYQGLQLPEMVERIEAELGRGLPADWLTAFRERRAEVFRRALRAVPGARGAVERIAGAGVQVCVASQAGLEKTRLSLGLTGLAPLFPDGALFSAALVARGKPHPDLFLHAAAHLGVAPARCVVVEDSPSGVAAAISAAMRVFAYTADPAGPPLLDPAAEPLGALSELPGRLGI
jgi:beta-phosphoglucomutase-like phosphatase (HAD superfamily)